MVQISKTSNRRASGAGRKIYDSLRSQIADGTLPAGTAAPSTRALAEELGVSRTTVTAAYEQLTAEGYLITSAGRAARIASVQRSDTLSDARSSSGETPRLSAYGVRMATMETPSLPPSVQGRIDFLYGALTVKDFPTRAWRRAYQQALQQEPACLYYAPPEGDLALRQSLVGYLRRARGLVCEAEQILLVHGAQQGIDLCARLLLDRGDAFVFEEPGYRIARQSFEATGGRCIPASVDESGLQTDGLPQQRSIRLAYVTPSHQFPLGGVLPIGRRMALLEWAKQRNAWIIEDDYDGEFRYGQRPIDALQSMDTDGRVIYIGTFSKALSPQLRLGYLVLPHALVSVFRQTKRLSDRHVPMLEQHVLNSLIESGAYERHVRHVRREYERRRTVLLNSINRLLPDEVCVTGTAAGLHVVLWLPFLGTEHESTLVAMAHKEGVGVFPVSPLFTNQSITDTSRPAGLILGYAGLSVDEIQRGIGSLAMAIAQISREHSGPDKSERPLPF